MCCLILIYAIRLLNQTYVVQFFVGLCGSYLLLSKEVALQYLALKVLIKLVFLAHLSTECSVSYCGHSTSVGVHPSVHNFLVNTLASTNISQSAPNLVKVYMTIRSQMNSIMELIGPELSELSALESENLRYLTLFTL